MQHFPPPPPSSPLLSPPPSPLLFSPLSSFLTLNLYLSHTFYIFLFCESVCLSHRQGVCMSVFLSLLLGVWLSVSPSRCLYVCLSISQFGSLSVCPFWCLSLRLDVSLSLSPFGCLSLCEGMSVCLPDHPFCVSNCLSDLLFAPNLSFFGSTTTQIQLSTSPYIFPSHLTHVGGCLKDRRTKQ